MSESGNRPRALWAAFIFAVVAQADARPGETRLETSVAAIEKAWKERDASFPTVKVVWEEAYVIPKGGLSQLWERLPKEALKVMNPTGGQIPRDDLTFKVQGKAHFHGGVVGLERDGPEWSPAKQQLIPIPVRSWFDGKNFWQHLPQGNGPVETPSGTINVGEACPAASHTWFRPLFLAYRPSRVGFRQVVPGDFSLTGQALTIHGIHCIEAVTMPGGLSSSRVTYWIAPSRDHQVMRFTGHRRGTIGQQFDADYRQDKAGRWVIDTWQISVNGLTGSSAFVISGKVQSTETEGLEAPRPLEFPPATMVYDERKPAKERHYMTTKRSGDLVINADRARSPYSQLAEEAETRDRSGFSWWAWAGMLCVAALLCLAVYMRASRRKSGECGPT